MQHGPHAAENRVAGGRETRGRLAGRAGSKQHVRVGKDFIRLAAAGRNQRLRCVVACRIALPRTIEQLFQLVAEPRVMLQALAGERGVNFVIHDVDLGLCDFGENLRQGDLRQLRAGARKRRGRVLDRGHGRRQGRVPLVRATQTDARRLRQWLGQQVASAHRRNEQSRVGNRARECPQGIEAVGKRLDTGARQRAMSRLVADDAAVARWADHGAGGLRAVSERHHAIGHRRGRAAGRTAGRMQRIVRICGLARIEPGEFGGDGLAQHQRARGACKRNTGCVGAGSMTGIHGRTVCGRHVCRVDQILHAEGQAVQRAPHRAGVEMPRLCEHGIGIDMYPGPHRGFALFDARQTGARQLLGRDFTRRKAPGCFAGAELVQLLHAVSPD